MLFGKKKKTAPRSASRRVVPRRIVRASATRHKELDDFEGEPGMKLSQAFIIVLVLHVLAVGGIYGFNKFKEARQQNLGKSTGALAALPAAPPPPVKEEKPAPAPSGTRATTVAGKTYTVVAGDTLQGIARRHDTTVAALEKANGIGATSVIRVGQILTIAGAAGTAAATTPPAAAPKPTVVAKAPAVKPAEPQVEKATPATTESGKVYVVQKGDNPYSIARRHNVTQAALMEKNNIDDPRKLQIGQKLVIP